MASAKWRRLGPEQNALLIITPAGLWLARLLIGLPLLGFGLFMLFAFVAGPISYLLGREEELSNVLMGALVTGLIGACILPLGWYLVFMRRTTVVDPVNRQVWEVIDYRFGKRIVRRDIASFKEVRVGCEEAGDARRKDRRPTRPVLVNTVRLIPRRTGETSSQEIAFFDLEKTEEPVVLGKLVGELLGLPVRVNLKRD